MKTQEKGPPDKGFTLKVHPEGDTGGSNQGSLNFFAVHLNPRTLNAFAFIELLNS
jgi:hypothetical protein